MLPTFSSACGSGGASFISTRVETRRQILALHDVAALFDAATTDHFRLWLMVAFGTAARPGAILQLKTDQIDLAHRLIDFNPVGRAQTKKRRPVLPICDALLPWLRNLEPGFVIRWKRDQEEPIKHIQTAFDAARTRAKFSPAITPYSIRHTVAVELRKRGVPMAEVAGFLGHKMERFATTEIYARYAPDFRGAAVRAIDDFFRELSPLLARPLLGFELENQPTPAELRAHCVPKLSALVPQVIDFMVGVRPYTLFLQSPRAFACCDREYSTHKSDADAQRGLAARLLPSVRAPATEDLGTARMPGTPQGRVAMLPTAAPSARASSHGRTRFEVSPSSM